MISRKKILSKSCDELTVSESDISLESDEDVWHQKDKLYQDHIQEILNKWDQIDDEIWGKLICMERNRRVAKAYIRVPVISVTGNGEGFDGYRIGLSGFENPHRDPKIEEIKKHIGSGIKIKMDSEGNILAKRLSKSTVIVREWHTDILEPYSSCISDDVVNLRGKLNLSKSYRIFDMQKFQKNIAHEMKDAYPDRRKLEKQCIVSLGFVKDATDLLDVPCWIMIINIVALEVLKSKLQPVASKRNNVSLNKIFAPLSNKIKNNNTEDEESYTDLNSSTNSECKQEIVEKKANDAKILQPKSNKLSNKHEKLSEKQLEKLDIRRSIDVPTPDYDTASVSSAKSQSVSRRISDPYYSGFMARVPDYGNEDKKWKQQYRGYLNSVLRLLPMQTSTGLGKHSSSSGSFPIDSDDIYGHIYSSISDSKSSRQSRHYYKHKYARNRIEHGKHSKQRITAS